MKKKFYESTRWLFNMVIATIAWMFVCNIIDEYQYVDWCFLEMINDGDLDGFLYCICGTACVSWTIDNLIKWFTKTVKEIKG